MLRVQIPDESEFLRIEALDACGILATPREPAFDNFVYAVAQMFRVPIAMLNLVTADRVWAKARVGPMPDDSSRMDTFCHAVIDLNQLVVVEDAQLDIRFSGLPCVIDAPRVRFFIGAPLYGQHRQPIGSLCAMDRQPRSVPERQKAHLQQLADQAGELLRLRVPGLDVSA